MGNNVLGSMLGNLLASAMMGNMNMNNNNNNNMNGGQGNAMTEEMRQMQELMQMSMATEMMDMMRAYNVFKVQCYSSRPFPDSIFAFSSKTQFPVEFKLYTSPADVI